jgi:DNA-3-methyladenine glycosylase II
LVAVIEPQPQVSPAEAAAEVGRRDAVMATLIHRVGPFEMRPPLDDYFSALARSILYQQLAGAAAAAIHGRFVQAVGGRVTAPAVLAASEDALRQAGLSRSKLLSVKDLALKATDGTVPLDGLDELDDEEIVRRLSEVRGIGRWTAEMFLIFQLRRLDVWPVDDLGVRNGYGIAYQVPMPTPKQLLPLGDRFRPFRTVVAWYCWQAVHLSRAARRPAGRGDDGRPGDELTS